MSVRHDPGPVEIEPFRHPPTVRARVAFAYVHCRRCCGLARIEMWIPETVFDYLPKEFHAGVVERMLTFLRAQGEERRELMESPIVDAEADEVPECEVAP